MQGEFSRVDCNTSADGVFEGKAKSVSTPEALANTFGVIVLIQVLSPRVETLGLD